MPASDPCSGEPTHTLPAQRLAPTLDRANSETQLDGPLPCSQTPQIGRFSILRQLGSGGMGTVYAAYDDQLERRVALKLLHSRGTTTAEQRHRVLREAKALARVTHPRVVSIYEVGEADGHTYLAMEFVEGQTLRCWQHEHRYWRDVLEIYVQAGEGLSAAHAAGVVHCDFKPDNVLVGKDGRARVADFGVARLGISQPSAPDPDAAAYRNGGGSWPITGAVTGTPGYMSPEQQAGMGVSAESDQFSFCAALYEALYGILPIPDLSLAEHKRNVLGAAHAPSAVLLVPEEILHILIRGLARASSARFPSMRMLLRALSSELGSSAGGAAVARRRIVFSLISAVVVLMIIAQVLLAHGIRLHRSSIGVSLLLLTVCMSLGYYHRQTLLANPFHLRMWALLFVTFFQILLMRLITNWHAMPFSVFYPLEMLSWAATTAYMAMTMVRWLWWLPVALLLAAALALLLSTPPRQLFILTYAVTILSILWAWQRAAEETVSR